MLSEFLKIGDYKVAYDGVRLADYFVVRGVDMPWRPPITVNELTIDGKPGSWYVSSQIGTRDITVKLGFISANKRLETTLDSWLNRAWLVGKTKECRLDLGDGYHVFGVMSGNTPLTKEGIWSKTEVTFHCSDPRVYRNSHELPLVSGINKVRILGGYPVEPIITVRNPSQTFEARNNITGRLVRLPECRSDETLIIDMQKHKATSGGLYKPADPTVTSFWDLEPGEQEISLVTGTGTLTYTEAYL